MAWVFPEPASSAGTITVTADVSTTMVDCTIPLEATAFPGTVDNTSVATSSTDATSTNSSSGTFFLKIYSAGTNTAGYPGAIWGAAAGAVVESPNAALSASATLVAGTEGYGVQAATTSGSNLLIAPRYNYASSTIHTVGGLATSGTSQIIASSGAAISNEIVQVTHKMAVAPSTPGGSYSDTIYYTCSSSP